MLHEKELERMVDTLGLAVVLEMLSQVCHEKADHIRTIWQDKQTAGCWDMDGSKIDKLATLIQRTSRR
jgi:hypothetical protein